MGKGRGEGRGGGSGGSVGEDGCREGGGHCKQIRSMCTARRHAQCARTARSAPRAVYARNVRTVYVRRAHTPRALRSRTVRAHRAHCLELSLPILKTRTVCGGRARCARAVCARSARTVRAHRAHCTHTLRGKVKPTNFELSLPILELSLPILELSLPILKTRTVCGGRARCARAVCARSARTVRAHRAHCTHTLRGKVKPTNFELSLPILELSLPILELSLPVLKTRTVCGGRARCARTVRAVRAYSAHGARVQYARCVRTVRAVRAYRARGVRVQGARTVRTDRAEKKHHQCLKTPPFSKQHHQSQKKYHHFCKCVRCAVGARGACVRCARIYSAQEPHARVYVAHVRRALCARTL